MRKRYYLDTSIWRDYFENRTDRFRPLGEWAFLFIKKAVQNSDLILYSGCLAFGDTLHTILARDNKAIMVTRDKHFYKLKDVVCIKKPEELI